MSEERLVRIAREIDELREKIEALHKKADVNLECIHAAGTLSVVLSYVLDQGYYLVLRILLCALRDASVDEVSKHVNKVVNRAHSLFSQAVNSLSQDVSAALKPLINSYSEAIKEAIKIYIAMFLEYAKYKKVSFEKALHALSSTFNGWSFLKWISDDIVLETYGSEALGILKKYKETFLSGK